jgi:3-oxoacyl-[acyl-carrier protein] reductase
LADFDGLHILITGGASGLGAATAIGAAKSGAARVIICYATSEQEAEATAETCRSAGTEARVVRGNVADDADCHRIVEAAADWGRLDALVNSAGVTRQVPHGDLDGLSADDFQQLFAVNAIGPFQMVRAARPLLEAGARASGRASSVVNVSSAAVFDSRGSSIAYTASKAAQNSITMALARALGRLIRVNAVCPGYMDTPRWKKGPDDQAAVKLHETFRAMVPLQVASTAADIADVVLSGRAGVAKHDRRVGHCRCWIPSR